MGNFLERGGEESYEQSVLFCSGFVNVSVGLILQRENRFLMIEEAKYDLRGLWNFPSGKVNVGELIILAAQREAAEETGYQVKVTDLMSVYYYLSRQPGSGGRSDRLTIRFNLWASLVEGVKPADFSSDTTSVEWKTLEEIHTLSQEGKLRNWITKRMIDEVERGVRLPLSALYTVDRR